MNLGINPSNGGRPPKERRVRAKNILVWGDIQEEEEMSFGVEILAAKNIYIKIIRCNTQEVKYNLITKFDIGIVKIIHPMWPIDENANKGRISVCIKPPKPPTRALSAAKGAIKK